MLTSRGPPPPFSGRKMCVGPGRGDPTPLLGIEVAEGWDSGERAAEGSGAAEAEAGRKIICERTPGIAGMRIGEAGLAGIPPWEAGTDGEEGREPEETEAAGEPC